AVVTVLPVLVLFVALQRYYIAGLTAGSVKGGGGGGSARGDSIAAVMRLIEARFEEGLLKPETPLALQPGERVALIVVRHPDPRRWNLEALARGGDEDRALAEQGLSDWVDSLDREDDR